MSKTYYCHEESPIGITCQHASDDGRCLAATGWLGRLTVNCDYCKDYPHSNADNPSSKKVDWSKGVSLPIKPLEKRTCKTCKYLTKHTDMKCKINKISRIKYLTAQNKRLQVKIKQLENQLERSQKLLPGFIANAQINAQITAYEEAATKFENELDQKVEQWYFEEQHENFMSVNKVLAFHDDMINELTNESIKNNVYECGVKEV